MKQFEAVSIRKQEIEELMKTTRGRLYPTITLLIASLKPYFKEEKLKNIKIRKIEGTKAREEIIKEKILSNEKFKFNHKRKLLIICNA